MFPLIAAAGLAEIPEADQRWFMLSSIVGGTVLPGGKGTPGGKGNGRKGETGGKGTSLNHPDDQVVWVTRPCRSDQASGLFRAGPAPGHHGSVRPGPARPLAGFATAPRQAGRPPSQTLHHRSSLSCAARWPAHPATGTAPGTAPPRPRRREVRPRGGPRPPIPGRGSGTSGTRIHRGRGRTGRRTLRARAGGQPARRTAERPNHLPRRCGHRWAKRHEGS